MLTMEKVKMFSKNRRFGSWFFSRVNIKKFKKNIILSFRFYFFQDPRYALQHVLGEHPDGPHQDSFGQLLPFVNRHQ